MGGHNVISHRLFGGWIKHLKQRRDGEDYTPS